MGTSTDISGNRSRNQDELKMAFEMVTFQSDKPLRLDSGVDLYPVTQAYNTYGTLNADKSNAVLVCHALTLDQHAANQHPVTGKEGWWTGMIGPGRPIDTDRFFVICPNVIGGCQGTTGPESVNPGTDKPYGLDFPVITIADMVRAQVQLIDHLGIDKLFCVAGGSMGGMQTLEWASALPGPGLLCDPHRHGGTSLGAEHRVS